MDIPVRRALVGRVCATGVALLLGLSACGSPPPPTDVTSDVDRQRAEFLTQEPILELAVDTPRVRPGVVHSDKVGWDRTEVSAELFTTSGGHTPDAGEVEKEVATATAALRESKWTIHWEMCLPPPLYDMFGNEFNPVTIPVQVPRLEGYEWIAAAYKIVDGVSYAALVVGARGENSAFVDVLLRAPNARDESNLFPTAPAALPSDQNCAEDGTVSDEVQKAGTPQMIRDWWPFPSQTHTRDPNTV